MLLHCCCAPCAGYAFEYLSPFYILTALFYNPNISPGEEFEKRAGEFEKLLKSAQYPNHVEVLMCGRDPGKFEAVAAPFSDEPEGGLRCRLCFELRLGETADRAKKGGYDCFATTLSVSPHKNALILGEIGESLAEKHGVSYQHLDLKKRGGYKRSVELSKLYGLYRQNYCGCRPHGLR